MDSKANGKKLMLYMYLWYVDNISQSSSTTSKTLESVSSRDLVGLPPWLNSKGRTGDSTAPKRRSMGEVMRVTLTRASDSCVADSARSRLRERA